MARAAGRLVGRDAELGRFGDVVERARSGARSTVVIEADAGLGKSRLVSEALAAHRDPTDLVGVAYGVELTGGQIPYGTTTDLLRTLVRDAGVDQVRAAAGAYAPALAPLCPALGPEADAEATAARILPACATTIEQLADQRLVWLVIDDLPWVDPASRDLVGYLVRVLRSSRLLVVTTVRSHDPTTDPAVTELVETLATLDGVDRIPLTVLGKEDTTALVADLTGGRATPSQVERVLAAGQGSPLLTEQLIAAGLDDSRPEVVVSPMLARIRRLDTDTLHLVQLAALGDGHLSHRLLKLAYSEPDAVFDSAVDRALDVRLLQYRADEREFTFSHPLLREAAEDTLTPALRLRGHERWGQVLSTPQNHHDEARLLIAAAHHWAATDDDVASFTAALTAARATNRMGDAAGTADLLLRAWQLWDRVPGAAGVAGRSRDDLMLDLSDALQSSDRLAECIPIFAQRARTDPARLPVLRRCGRCTSPSRHATSERCAVKWSRTGPGGRVRPRHSCGNRRAGSSPGRSTGCVGPTVGRPREVLRDVRARRSPCAGGRQPARSPSRVRSSRSSLPGRGRHDEALAVCASGLADCLGLVDFVALETTQGDVLAESGQLQAGCRPARADAGPASGPCPRRGRVDDSPRCLAVGWHMRDRPVAPGRGSARASAQPHHRRVDHPDLVDTDDSVFACRRGRPPRGRPAR